MGAEVKPIELAFRFDREVLKLEACEVLKARLGSFERALRIDHLLQNIQDIDFSRPINQEKVVAAVREDTKTGQILRDTLLDPVGFALFELDMKAIWLDLVKHRRISVLYDGKPLQVSSFGQRCTAAIVVLLALGNSPIIIDEPEAHLDSGLIARYLVHLVKEVKRNRQIVFATHNANFVINGDAELVLALEVSTENKSDGFGTSIENMKYRDHLLSLEGGEEAFRQREYRYGMERPD